MIVVADATPLHYLILIGEISLLQASYREVIVPESVIEELTDDATPERVREWARNPPPWIRRARPPASDLTFRKRIGVGEADAIRIAVAIRADLVIVMTWTRALKPSGFNCPPSEFLAFFVMLRLMGP